MDICIVGENREEIYLWSSLLSNSLPDYKVKQMTISSLEGSELPGTDFAILLMTEINNSIVYAANMLRTLTIPILCVVTAVDHIEKNLNNKLVSLGIQGVLVSGKTSLENVKTAINLVANGGVYIEPSLNESVQPEIAKETLDLTEWQVFSLTAKGLNTTDIATTLQISVNKVNAYQARFKALYLENYTSIETL